MNATQRFTSAAWNSENASTPSPVGSKPMARNLSSISGCLTISAMAWPSTARASGGMRRPIDAEPPRQLDAGDARLLEGRHVRKTRQPIRTADREPFDQSGFDLLHDHRKHLDEQIDRAAHEIVERRG